MKLRYRLFRRSGGNYFCEDRAKPALSTACGPRTKLRPCGCSTPAMKRMRLQASHCRWPGPIWQRPILRWPSEFKSDTGAAEVESAESGAANSNAFRVTRPQLGRHIPAPREWNDSIFAEQAQKLGVRIFDVMLDLRCSKSAIKESFGKWLDRLEIDKTKTSDTRGQRRPWHRLRELSAFRLAEHFSFGQAQEYLRKDLGINVAKASRIIPNYKSDGSWSDAVNGAKDYRTELFPED